LTPFAISARASVKKQISREKKAYSSPEKHYVGTANRKRERMKRVDAAESAVREKISTTTTINLERRESGDFHTRQKGGGGLGGGGQHTY